MNTKVASQGNLFTAANQTTTNPSLPPPHRPPLPSYDCKYVSSMQWSSQGTQPISRWQQ